MVVGRNARKILRSAIVLTLFGFGFGLSWKAMGSDEEDKTDDRKSVQNEPTVGNMREIEGDFGEGRERNLAGAFGGGDGGESIGEEYSIDAVGQGTTLERGGDYVARYPIMSLVGVGDCVHKIIKFNEVTAFVLNEGFGRVSVLFFW